MSDPLTDASVKVATSLITEIFKTCFSSLKDAEEWLKIKKRQHDPLGIAAKKYSEKVEELYNSIKIIGMNNPLPLRNIYTRVNILRKLTARHRATVDELEQFFDRDRKSFGFIQETIDGMVVVNQLPKLIVLGKPGAGKTTFLKYIALQALDGNLSQKRIPVFIVLKNWSDSNLSLMDFTVRQFDICNFPKAEVFVEEMLKKGKCILLLDGLDEVSHNMDNVIPQIRDFTNKYSKNEFVLSCRIAGYNYCFEKFADVEIADFTDKQIQIFIKNWFGEEKLKAKLCWEKMKADNSIKELATIPLLLTMLCIAFDETMDFPSNRAELYKEALDALLKKWDSSRSIKRAEIYRHLSLRRKESMLSRIAAVMFEKDHYFFPQRALEGHIANYIQNLPEAKQETLEPDSEAILKAIEAQHGLFVERANRIYSFSHLTLQEYFTARYIVDNAARGTLKQIVDNHFVEDQWREVLLLISGMLEQADHFLLLMQKKINSFAEDKLVRVLLKEVSRNVEMLGDSYSTPMIRALALNALLNFVCERKFSTRMNNLIVALKISNELPIAIAKDTRFALDQDKAFFTAFARGRTYGGTQAIGNVNEIIRAANNDKYLEHNMKHVLKCIRELDQDLERTRDLEINRTLANLLDKTPDTLHMYLKTTKLLIDCITTECYLTKTVRQSIYDKLLREPD